MHVWNKNVCSREEQESWLEKDRKQQIFRHLSKNAILHSFVVLHISSFS